MHDISMFRLTNHEASDKINTLMSTLDTWSLEMDRESQDFWRFQSTDFPYAEYWMHQDKKSQSEFLAVLCKDKDKVKNYVVTMKLIRKTEQEV